MASNKDILEAQRFNRRRLIAAFSSGVPQGKEIIPPAPSRPLIFGLVLCLVLAAGAAVASRFVPVLPQGWENSTLVVVKGTGSRYFTIDGTLRPITNVTSARLLSEAGQFKISEVGVDALSGIPRGSSLGLVDVPDDVPRADALASNMWLSCPFGESTHSWIGLHPSGPEIQDSALVINQESLYVIANGKRHQIPSAEETSVRAALGLDAANPIPVNASWLNLFEKGSSLERLELEGAGRPVSGMPTPLSSAVLGSIVEVESGQDTNYYVVTGDGVITRLPPLAYNLYAVSKSAERAGNPITIPPSAIDQVKLEPDIFLPEDWPHTLGSLLPDDALPCASLKEHENSISTALLAWNPESAARAAGKKNGEELTPSAGKPSITVPGGTGALVRSTSGGTLGAVLVITDDGKAHGLGANYPDTLARLGWTQDDVFPIPSAWVALAPTGVDLLPTEAWNTVAAQ